MSKKYKVNINPKLPTDRQISDSMDFDLLIKKSNDFYNPRKLRNKMYTKRTVVMLVITIVAVVLAIMAS